MSESKSGETLQNVNKEKLNLQPSDVCITSSVLFPKYGTEGESDTLRGKLAIESIVKTIKAGYKYSLVYNTGTSEQFIKDLRQKISEVVSDKNNGEDVSDVFILTERKELEYSPTRQQAFEVAREKFHSKVLVTQEAEKDLLYAYPSFLAAINNGAHIAIFDRGVAKVHEHPDKAGLPESQFVYERSQNLEMDRVEQDAGLLSRGTEAFDRLIGFRMILNQEADTNFGKINPADLFVKLKFDYIDGFDQKVWGRFTTDFYSQAVYHGIPIAESLGLQIASVPVEYYHDQDQTNLENANRQLWDQKRIAHRKSIPFQHFDMVANILTWIKEGKWPQVLLESLEKDGSLGLRHFDRGRYTIKEGKIIERPTPASWVQNGEIK